MEKSRKCNIEYFGENAEEICNQGLLIAAPQRDGRSAEGIVHRAKQAEIK